MLRVYIVDDEPPFVRHLTHLVEAAPVPCTVVGSSYGPERALRDLSEMSPDLLICDIRMPDMDGITLLSKLRERGLACPVVFLTAYCEFEYARRAIGLDVIDYLLKPVEQAQLDAVLLKAEERTTRSSVQHASRAAAAYLANFNPDPEDKAALGGLKGFFMVITRPQGCFPVRELSRPGEDDGVVLLCKKAAPEQFGGIEISLLGLGASQSVREAYGRAEDRLRRLAAGRTDALVVTSGVIGEPDGIPRLLGELRKDLHGKIPFGATGYFNDRTIAALQSQEGPLAAVDSLYAKLRLDLRCHKADEAALEVHALLESCHGLPGAPLALVLGRFAQVVVESCPFCTRDGGRGLAESMAELPARVFDWASLEELVQNALRSALEFSRMEREHDGLVGRVMDYIDAHYAEALPIQELAENAHISPQYLIKLFKRECGLSPLQYVINRRLESAKRILLDFPDLSIKEVAAMVGYEDPLYFSRLFHRKAGVYPRTWRDAQREVKESR